LLLTVGSNSPSGSVAHFENSTGSCYINPTTTSLSCSSDVRLKTNIASLASSTSDMLLALRPVTYNWTSEALLTAPHTGFIAQEVQPIFPDLISSGPDGYLTMNYAGLTPYLVKAVQQIASITGTFKANLIAWLASASNGIHDLYASIIHSQEEHTQKLCVQKSDGSEFCVTGDQLAEIAAAGAATAAPGGNSWTASPPTPSPSTQPPPALI
jgi:endosialidase-like protein